MIALPTWLLHRIAAAIGQTSRAVAPDCPADPTLSELLEEIAAVRQLFEDERNARILEKWRQQQATLLLLGGLAVIAMIVLLPINPLFQGPGNKGYQEAGHGWVIHHVDTVLAILGLVIGLGTAIVGWLGRPRWLRGTQLVIALVAIIIAGPYLAERHLSVVTLPMVLIGALAVISARPPNQSKTLGRLSARLKKAGIGAVTVGIFASLPFALWTEWLPTPPTWTLLVLVLVALGGGILGIGTVWLSAAQLPNHEKWSLPFRNRVH